jgi:hypothetical protein
MPRLDGSPTEYNDDEMRPLRRQTAIAYPGNSIKLAMFYGVLLFATLFWVIPNIFFTVSYAVFLTMD